MHFTHRTSINLTRNKNDLIMSNIKGLIYPYLLCTNSPHINAHPSLGYIWVEMVALENL